jgi:hypothetical protein
MAFNLKAKMFSRDKSQAGCFNHPRGPAYSLNHLDVQGISLFAESKAILKLQKHSARIAVIHPR